MTKAILDSDVDAVAYLLIAVHVAERNAERAAGSEHYDEHVRRQAAEIMYSSTHQAHKALVCDKKKAARAVLENLQKLGWERTRV